MSYKQRKIIKFEPRRKGRFWLLDLAEKKFIDKIIHLLNKGELINTTLTATPEKVEEIKNFSLLLIKQNHQKEDTAWPAEHTITYLSNTKNPKPKKTTLPCAPDA